MEPFRNLLSEKVVFNVQGIQLRKPSGRNLITLTVVCVNVDMKLQCLARLAELYRILKSTFSIELYLASTANEILAIGN